MKSLTILIITLLFNCDMYAQGTLVLKYSNISVGTAKVGTPLSKIEKDFIRNTGSVERTIDSIYFIGEYAEYFGATLHSQKVIPPSGSADITISFAPKHIGAFFVEIAFISSVDTIRGNVTGTAIYIPDETSLEDGKELFSSSNDGLMLYPNPSSEYTNIYFTQHESTPATFEIVNLSGEVMLTYIEESSESIKKGNIKLDISSLPNGIYSVHCKMLNSIYSSRLSVIH